MFVLLETITAAFASIRAHGMRSFLTTLGIIIGVASVIAMVSIIQGLSYSIDQQFAGLGANSVVVTSYTPLEERLKGRIARLTQDDLDLISQRVDGIASITPILYSGTGGFSAIQFGSQQHFANVYGTTYAYQDVGQYYVEKGRFLSDSDNETRRRVVVIGTEVQKKLTLPENPIDQFIEINGEWVKIIGVLEAKGDLLGQSFDNVALLPYSTMRSLVGNLTDPDIQIQISISDLTQRDAIIGQIKRLLRKAHDLQGQRDDFQVQTAEQLQETIGNITNMITAVMSGILGISLLVGGIGIMNIMLVSVTERTREIGICKAIGAKRHHILLQFLFESVALCLLGGFIGLLLGYGLGSIASLVNENFPPAHIPVWAIMLAFGFSASVGIVFGILPAAKAANLDPIDALRYE